MLTPTAPPAARAPAGSVDMKKVRDFAKAIRDWQKKTKTQRAPLQGKRAGKIEGARAVRLSKMLGDVRAQEVSEEGLALLRELPGVSAQLAAETLSTAQRLAELPYERRVCRVEAHFPHPHMPGEPDPDMPVEEYVDRISEAARWTEKLGLECHAGHGLTFDTVAAVAAIAAVRELNIGHFLVGEAIFGGLESSIKRMRALMDKARADASGERSA